MGLECLLSEIKAGKLGGTGSPSGERIIYTSHLRELMKRHLAEGGSDGRLFETRAEMASSGVPLDRMGVDKAVDPSPGAGGRPAADSLWQCGDQEWPLREDVLDGFLDAHPAISSHATSYGGYCRKASLVRVHDVEHDSDSFLVKDRDEIPSQKTYSHRFSCSERHQGLCATAHRDIYPQALLFARNLEACLQEPLLYNFILLQAMDDADREMQPSYYHFSRLKKRMFHGQLTHVLTRCLVCPGSPAGVIAIRLGTRGPKLWAFVSLWTVARRLLVNGAKKAKVSHVTHSSSMDGTVQVGRVVGEWEVWPGVFQRPRPPPPKKFEVPLDDDDAHKEKKKAAPAPRPKGGGIKVRSRSSLILSQSICAEGFFKVVSRVPIGCVRQFFGEHKLMQAMVGFLIMAPRPPLCHLS